MNVALLVIVLFGTLAAVNCKPNFFDQVGNSFVALGYGVNMFFKNIFRPKNECDKEMAQKFKDVDMEEKSSGRSGQEGAKQSLRGLHPICSPEKFDDERTCFNDDNRPEIQEIFEWCVDNGYCNKNDNNVMLKRCVKSRLTASGRSKEDIEKLRMCTPEQREFRGKQIEILDECSECRQRNKFLDCMANKCNGPKHDCQKLTTEEERNGCTTNIVENGCRECYYICQPPVKG